MSSCSPLTNKYVLFFDEKCLTGNDVFVVRIEEYMSRSSTPNARLSISLSGACNLVVLQASHHISDVRFVVSHPGIKQLNHYLVELHTVCRFCKTRTYIIVDSVQ